MEDKKIELTLDELLSLGVKQTKLELDSIENEGLEGREETVENIQKEIRAIKEQTELKKHMFINELKAGLAEEIKENRGVTLVTKPKSQKIMDGIKKFFLKF